MQSVYQNGQKFISINRFIDQQGSTAMPPFVHNSHCDPLELNSAIFSPQVAPEGRGWAVPGSGLVRQDALGNWSGRLVRYST